MKSQMISMASAAEVDEPRVSGVAFAPSRASVSLNLRDIAVALAIGIMAGMVIAGPAGGSPPPETTVPAVAIPGSIRLESLEARVPERSTTLVVVGQVSGGTGDVTVVVSSGARTLAQASAPIRAGRFRAELVMNL